MIFTGRPGNAEKLLSEMKENSILVLNGTGHNPLVITDSANIDLAVEGALLVKGFNGGQDCAGPDAILVHQDVANEFIEKFTNKFLKLKTGAFHESDTVIGPIHRFSELERFSKLFHDNQSDILLHDVVHLKKILKKMNNFQHYFSK